IVFMGCHVARRCGTVKARLRPRRKGLSPPRNGLYEEASGGACDPSCFGSPMSDGTFRSVRALKREISSDPGGSLFKTIAGLWPYIWPSDRRDLKIRVLIAMLLLLLAKLATIAVPFTFKWAVDALTGEGTAPVAPSGWLMWTLAAPILMTIAYGGSRILMAVLTQMRDGVFA